MLKRYPVMRSWPTGRTLPSTFQRQMGIAALLLVCASSAVAGQGSAAPASTPSGQARPTPRTATFPRSTAATVNQLMRGLFFPASNVVFAAQLDDPASIPRDVRSSVSTDLLKSVFGGWEAVENSALAIAEGVPLLLIEGRACSNGRPSPVGEAEWQRYAEATRTAALLSAKAAHAQDQDLIVDATGQLSESCSACHRAYRSDGGLPPDPLRRCAPRASGQGRPR